MKNKLIRRVLKRLIIGLKYRLTASWFLKPYFNRKQIESILSTKDPVRYGCILLALEQIEMENIPGEFAECGVYKGHLSKFIHDNSPNRLLYLFDTFEGFDKRDLDLESLYDNRFNDTSAESVLNYIDNRNGVIIKKGYFPETAVDIAGEKFSLVIIDFDKYNPTKAALEFFYPLLSKGGFIFIHDYSNPESNWACSKALNEFLIGKSEKLTLIPDAWGSATFRKI